MVLARDAGIKRFKSFKPFKTFKWLDRARNDLNGWNCWNVLNHETHRYALSRKYFLAPGCNGIFSWPASPPRQNSRIVMGRLSK